MNICVVGAGAIGGWVAAKLALAGERVMVARGSCGAARRRSGLLDEGGDESATRSARRAIRTSRPQDLSCIARKGAALPRSRPSSTADRAGHA